MNAVKTIKSMLIFLFVFSSFFSVFKISPVSAGSYTVGPTITAGPFGGTYQRYCFYYDNYFYAIYSNGTHVVYRNSSDAQTWTQPSSGNPVLTDSDMDVGYGYDMNIWFNGSHVLIVWAQYWNNGLIRIKLGTPSSGEISWGTSYTVASGVSGVKRTTPSVCQGTDNYIYVSYAHEVQSPFKATIWAVKSSNPYQISSWASPVQISIWHGYANAIVPSTSAYITWVNNTGTRLFGKTFNGAAGALEEISQIELLNQYYWSVIEVNGDLHVAYQKTSPYDIVHRKRSDSSWSSEYPLKSGTPTLEPPMLSKVSTTPYAYYFDTDGGYLYRKKWDGSSWIYETIITSGESIFGYGMENVMYEADELSKIIVLSETYDYDYVRASFLVPPPGFYLLTVQSSPFSNVPFTIDSNLSYTTATFNLTGGSYALTISNTTLLVNGTWYKFKNWTISDGTNTTNTSIVVNLDANKTATAYYAPVHVIQIFSNLANLPFKFESVEYATPTTLYEESGNYTFSVKYPRFSDYKFANWVVDDTVYTQLSITIEINTNENVTITYVPYKPAYPNFPFLIALSDYPYSTTTSPQVTGWLANGYYYKIVYPGKLYSSVNGYNWTYKSAVGEGLPGGGPPHWKIVSIYAEGNYVYLALPWGSVVHFRRGYCSNGAVSWDSWVNLSGRYAVDVVSTAITKTPNGLIHVVMIQSTFVYWKQSLNSNGTAWTGWAQVTESSSLSLVGIVPLTEDSVYITWTYDARIVYGCEWSLYALGSGDTLVSSTSYGLASYGLTSSVPTEDVVNFVAVQSPSNNLLHVKGTITQPYTLNFADGFESGSFGAWSGTNVRSGDILETVTAPVHSGSYASHYYINHRYDGWSYIYKNMGATRKVLYEFWFRIGQIPSGQEITIARSQPSGVYTGGFVDVINDAGTLKPRIYYYDAGWQNGIIDYPLSTGTWYKLTVDTYFAESSGNIGYFKVWIDDNLLANRTDLWNEGYTSHIEVGISWSSGTTYYAYSELFIDDVTITAPQSAEVSWQTNIISANQTGIQSLALILGSDNLTNYLYYNKDSTIYKTVWNTRFWSQPTVVYERETELFSSFRGINGPSKFLTSFQQFAFLQVVPLFDDPYYDSILLPLQVGKPLPPPPPPSNPRYLNVVSEPITSVPFTVNGLSQTTPYKTSTSGTYTLTAESTVVSGDTLYYFQYWTIEDKTYYESTVTYLFTASWDVTAIIHYGEKPAPKPKLLLPHDIRVTIFILLILLVIWAICKARDKEWATCIPVSIVIILVLLGYLDLCIYTNYILIALIIAFIYLVIRYKYR